MKNSSFEAVVGAVVLAVAGLFFLLSLSITKNTRGISGGYIVSAEFANVDGLTIGSDVKVAGVKVGDVADIKLNGENYNAKIIMSIRDGMTIPTDSVFKITSSGLMGGKFVNIKIGGDSEYLADGSIAEWTESTMDLEDLISRFVFNSGDDKKNNKN